MAITHEQSAPLAPRRTQIAYQWAASIRAASGTLSRMPVGLMDSITVTGRLDGRYNERQELRQLSFALAERCGLKATIDMDGADFTVRFTRPATD